jgi:hypothetical protein
LLLFCTMFAQTLVIFYIICKNPCYLLSAPCLHKPLLFLQHLQKPLLVSFCTMFAQTLIVFHHVAKTLIIFLHHV